MTSYLHMNINELRTVAASSRILKVASLKVHTTRLVLVLEASNVKPTSREIVGWETPDMVRFDLWPLLQGRTMV